MILPRGQIQCWLNRWNGFGSLALLGQSARQIVVRRGEIRLELDRPLEVGNGFIPFPLLTQGVPQIELGNGGMRFELESPLKVWHGFVPFPLVAQRGS